MKWCIKLYVENTCFRRNNRRMKKRKPYKFLKNMIKKDIFIMYKTRLFFRLMSDKAKKKFQDEKRGKDWLSMALYCNTDGSEKQKPLIGIAKNLRFIRKDVIKPFPVIYRHNSKACMTGCLFKEWMLDVYKQVHKSQK